ncbi:MAG: succinyl-diaminopimelate desuccinylase [Cardiobacteriaceae bacterium]|nr:succinyl-diaminopimelate desuccinylase [Cardiobacteriaceae bacterium]
MRTLELLQELICRPSITPNDAGCQTLIAERLHALGFSIRHIHLGDTDNLWVTHGEGAPLVAFAGHTDVVPAGDEVAWTSPPFTPAIRDGKIYGRGVADMKAGVAAMVVALERLTAQPHPGTLALLLTSDEEGDALDGIQAVLPILEKEGAHMDYCIVGEPSCAITLGDQARNGRRGSLSLHLTVHGKQGHVAYPEKTRNPIHALASIVARLATNVWDKGNAHFPPTSFQTSNIISGTGAENVVPANAQCKMNWRYNTEHSKDSLQQQATDMIDTILADWHMQADYHWKLSGEPFLTDNPALMQALKDAVATHCGKTLRFDTGGGTSDARFIARYGTATIEFGPLIESIHQVDENVDISVLEPLTAVYVDCVRNLWNILAHHKD